MNQFQQTPKSRHWTSAEYNADSVFVREMRRRIVSRTISMQILQLKQAVKALSLAICGRETERLVAVFIAGAVFLERDCYSRI